MRDANVLIISTYPAAHALQGGQKRAAAIYENYKKNLHKVTYCAVYNRHAYPRAGASDIAVSQSTLRLIEENPHAEDVICGAAIYEDKEVRRRLSKLLKDLRPNIIQVEQVYPFIGLEKLIKECKLNAKIVYSSHNIEHEMKREIYEGVGMIPETANELVELIKSSEKLLCRVADLTVAVSSYDAEKLKGMGANKVIVAPNGIAKTLSTRPWRNYWLRHFKKNGITKKYVFVSSAHIPNWIGFDQIVGPRTGFLKPNERIVLAGSVCDLAKRNYGDLRADHVTFWKRAECVGRLSEESLAALLDVCDAILLPITEGGGSNLKTAEALLSGKKIIGTKYAFRAYESFMTQRNVYLIDGPEGFRQQIAELRKVDNELSQAELRGLGVNKVLWENCLKPLHTELTKL